MIYGDAPLLIGDGARDILVVTNDLDQIANKIIEIINNKFDGVRIASNTRKTVTELDKMNIIPKWYSIIDKHISS